MKAFLQAKSTHTIFFTRFYLFHMHKLNEHLNIYYLKVKNAYIYIINCYMLTSFLDFKAASFINSVANNNFIGVRS